MRVRVVVAAVAIALLAGSSAAAQDPAECLSTLADPIAWAGLPLEQTAEILGCRQLEDGRWVATTVGDTRRFRRPAPMASAIQSQIDVARSLVLDDIRAMAADPRLTQLFVYLRPQYANGPVPWFLQHRRDDPLDRATAGNATRLGVL